jgi:cytochrome-b5 reductase
MSNNIHSMTTKDLPESLTSAPIQSLIEPGHCQFTEEFIKVPLLENIPVSKTAYVARFGLPDATKSLGLSTCACILAGAEINGEMVVRPYTPISTNADRGTFDLLIRRYPDGKMSSFIAELKPSKEGIVAFKHIPFNVKIQYPFNSPKTLVMIAGGTGITPMIQALHAILGDEKSPIEKTYLLYGSRNKDDILGKEMLDNWAATHDQKLSVIHVLSHEEGNVSAEEGFKKGFIDRSLIESVAPPASSGKDVMIFVCGPPVMYDILCGPRNEDNVTGVLGELGYRKYQVYKF